MVMEVTGELKIFLFPADSADECADLKNLPQTFTEYTDNSQILIPSSHRVLFVLCFNFPEIPQINAQIFKSIPFTFKLDRWSI